MSDSQLSITTVSSKVVHGVDGNKKLISYNPTKGSTTVQHVRQEEVYLEHLETIIQRDYFPDLPGAKVSGEKGCDRVDALNRGGNDSHNPEKTNPADMSLDKYLANNTTEDNASFAELIEENEKKHNLKMLAFFASKKSDQLALTDSQQLALESGSITIGPRESLIRNNSVHFVPDGAPLTKNEMIEYITKERRIDASNTRFKRPVSTFLDKRRAKQKLIANLGRVGVDGKESASPWSTPQAAGYKFMDASPSPALHTMNQTPLMTWGELAGTPSRLDDGNVTPTVVSGTPAFRISSPSHREQLAHQLADKASRQRIRGRQELVKRVHSGFSSPSRALLSPAAQRFLTNTGKLSRPGTGASVSNFSSTGMPGRPVTPRHLRELGVIRRPTTGSSSISQSPAVSHGNKDNEPAALLPVVEAKPSTPSMETVACTASITDNLLNLRHSGTTTTTPDPLHIDTP